MRIKLRKCEFVKKSVKFLGHIVSAEGISPDPTKVKSIAKFPQPKNVGELRTLLGMLSYYRKYIRNFAGIAHPLTALTKKDTPFVWER